MPEIKGMTYASDEFVANLNNSFESGKTAILNAASDYKVTGSVMTYYVSSSTGNDDNDGLSPEQAWKTIEKVNSASVNKGSVILFKRGDEWNREGLIRSKGGVTFSAYSEGAKPQISNYVDASLASDWTNVGENLWVYSGEYATQGDNPSTVPGSYISSLDADTLDNHDIGNIIFNNGEGWGVKIMKKNEANTSVSVGTVYTGFGTLTHNAKAFADQTDLSQHLEFYHNCAEGRVYLYCEGGNPADVFNNIKLVLRGYLFYGENEQVKDTCVDNIAFKFAGCHGISTVGAVNFTVQNCEIGWIGGSIQTYTFGGRDEPTRFGEGIQNWGNCDGFYIKNNYIHQIYDGATSSQQSVDPNLTSVLMRDAVVSGNYFENNTWSIEFWFNIVDDQNDNDSFKLQDWSVSGNMIRKTGYGFGNTRPDNDDGYAASMTDSMGWPKAICENIVYSENTVWDNADGVFSGLGWNTSLYVFKDNVVVHEYGKNMGKLARDFDNIAQWDIKAYPYTSETIDMLTEKNIIGNNMFYYTYRR